MTKEIGGNGRAGKILAGNFKSDGQFGVSHKGGERRERGAREKGERAKKEGVGVKVATPSRQDTRGEGTSLVADGISAKDQRSNRLGFA